MRFEQSIENSFTGDHNVRIHASGAVNPESTLRTRAVPDQAVDTTGANDGACPIAPPAVYLKMFRCPGPNTDKNSRKMLTSPVIKSAHSGAFSPTAAAGRATV